MKKYVKYFWYVMRHKWYVMIECFKYGIYWRGIIHDFSKFRPSEFFPYANHFFGDGIKDKSELSPFNFAWMLHQKRNDHHWQWWCLMLNADESSWVFSMSRSALLEMVADWKGAQKAIHGKVDLMKWYDAHKDLMAFAPETKMELQILLAYEIAGGKRYTWE